MVKIGFICEGYTEQILLESDTFKSFLYSINLQPLPVINAEGAANLLPHNIEGYLRRLEIEGAEVIVILTDLDEGICITKTKARIGARPQDVIVIAVKQIEAWFLACTPAMQALLGQHDFTFDFPEQETTPFETINQLLIKHTARGIGRKAGKIRLVTRLISHGLDITLSARHHNCPSAKYFIDKLTQIGTTN